ncbi:hypothetical protein [Bremerella sp. P1]|uniref:hypothetical protein n=1 Tax=Bremerella sp. P1 TaxID=3026424 RepID=UPI0023675A11|nr:hypothetical protein [Bremerella sp. P1]WDI43468.1 hypothetical protein PSR63_05855 [Bremerella sp. P1]
MFLLAQQNMDPGWLSALACLLMGIVGVVLLWRGRSALTGTTLILPWAWSLLAWIALCGSEVAIGVMHWYEVSASDDQIRYLAAMTLFCPQLSQVGAKRPQWKVWQGVVAVFLLMLWFPVFQVWAFSSIGQVDPGWIWGTFLAALILAGFINNFPTRFSPTALCLAVAQINMTYTYLPMTTSEVTVKGSLLAIALGLIGIGSAIQGGFGRPENLRPEDRAWIDFRDSFGAFWAARVMLRVNDSAARYEWGLWLNWNGFHQVEIVGSHADFRDGVREALVTCLRKLLYDFVDDAWLDERLPQANKRKKGLEDLDV